MSRISFILAALIALAIWNVSIGIKAFAIVEIIWAITVLIKRRVQFGIEGFEKPYSISGWGAVVIGLIALGLGFALLIQPDYFISLDPRY